MEYRRGVWVRNRKQPEWGIGEVLDSDGEKVRILFSEIGERTLVVRYAAMEEVPAPADTTHCEKSV